MNAIDAVEIVLANAGEPLGYREITRRVLEQGLWQTEGLTPEATINARLGTDIKDLAGGSRFQRTGPGVFALRKWGLPEAAVRGAKPKQPKEVAAVVAGRSEPADQPVSAAGAPGPGGDTAAKAASSPSKMAQTGEEIPRKSSSSFSFTDAAEAVLEQFGHKQPVHYRAITEKALTLGLVNTKGLTSEATLYAQVLTRRSGRHAAGSRRASSCTARA